jgi:hypothetical protein
MVPRELPALLVSPGRRAADLLHPLQSNAGLSDGEGEGFADDQVPTRTRPTDPANIPRVEDKIGLIIQESFEQFIEGSVPIHLHLGLIPAGRFTALV